MKKDNFSIGAVNEMVKEMSDNSVIPYKDLPQYDFFLSQVIDYLNDRFENEKYTNNIVQNYIKSEVISKPEDGKKRGYTKLHLAQLALLSYMRPILTTEEIKKVFRLAFNEINDRSDDIISWEKAYKVFCEIQRNSFDDFFSQEYFKEDKLKDLMKDMNLKGKDEERILVFLMVMTLIAQASVIKKVAQRIVDEYNEL
ncbi:DUF1836 domain-containing protein [Oceanirhabdus seepicola]|uniref:DUF1836 domain-containing protein n=1 Tax=Oceanirhabdus seepicola TaxID=2828781 RepID=A0A9J6P7Q4_9CLOT|nr:DUF1836 domain-containing protein [Oceanirhabdus seepicola]MCM1992009.1 DUF1836 domain-containing protein [Oceanirhabdus seepicola]